MNAFPGIRRVIIWIEDLAQLKQSWESILKIAPAMLYPGHGRPFQTRDLKKIPPVSGPGAAVSAEKPVSPIDGTVKKAKLLSWQSYEPAEKEVWI